MKDKRFLLGVGLIAASSAVGWISLFVGGVSSVSAYLAEAETPFLTLVFSNIYIRVWFFSWIPFFAGLVLAGKKGIEASRNLTKRFI